MAIRTYFVLYLTSSLKCLIHSTFILNNIRKFKYNNDLINSFIDNDLEDL
jgi:hypothetical protein